MDDDRPCSTSEAHPAVGTTSGAESPGGLSASTQGQQINITSPPRRVKVVYLPVHRDNNKHNLPSPESPDVSSASTQGQQ